MLMTDVHDEERRPKHAIEDYMTLRQAVRFSGYTDQYLRRIAKEGRIGAVKFGHFWMISQSSLQAYMERASDRNLTDKRFGPREAQE